MTVKTYSDLPSSAVNRIDVDTENNTVVVQYKAGNNPAASGYKYAVEDASAFDVEFLAEFDQQDFSVGQFLNEKLNSGVLTATGDQVPFEISAEEEQPIDPTIYPAPVPNGTDMQYPPLP